MAQPYWFLSGSTATPVQCWLCKRAIKRFSTTWVKEVLVDTGSGPAAGGGGRKVHSVLGTSGLGESRDGMQQGKGG